MATLADVLELARKQGFLGPGPVAGHIEHAEGFVHAIGEEPEGPVVDLGSGAGVPGLVLALAWSRTPVVLLDASERRTRFLSSATERLGLGRRVTVVRARAEEAGQDPTWRGRAEVVVARSFGPPGVTAECGGPLLQEGGRLVVSEPPDDSPTRWPEDGLAQLGLQAVARLEQAFSRFQILRQVAPCPAGFPRRVGVPARRPLF